MFPDVAKSILAACTPSTSDAGGTIPTGTSAVLGRSFIVDSELVAVDRTKGGKLRAFQDLSTRHAVEAIISVGRCNTQVPWGIG